ncbi:hypothetical protein ACFWWM_29745 [Streptomyces sp. NPDC058682]|uniref:hypothetical protein n=1 Tax=Streptomyces sp. NPDC058682 TaxID=3346596 RepID=UPI0036678C46
MLVNLFPDGGVRQFGQCIDEDGRASCFDLVYDPGTPKAAGEAVLRTWSDIADAFVRRPPARRTVLPE